MAGSIEVNICCACLPPLQASADECAPVGAHPLCAHHQRSSAGRPASSDPSLLLTLLCPPLPSPELFLFAVQRCARLASFGSAVLLSLTLPPRLAPSQHITQLAAEPSPHLQYFVLLILTDGWVMNRARLAIHVGASSPVHPGAGGVRLPLTQVLRSPSIALPPLSPLFFCLSGASWTCRIR